MISFCNNKESFIQVQQTALFYATKDSESEDDVLDVLQYLVDEKGINVNLADEVILAISHVFVYILIYIEETKCFASRCTDIDSQISY